jgi:hypothetical protein
MGIDVKKMTTDELKNAVENQKHWINQKETFADMWGRNTLRGAACLSDAHAHKRRLEIIIKELSFRYYNKK